MSRITKEELIEVNQKLKRQLIDAEYKYIQEKKNNQWFLNDIIQEIFMAIILLFIILGVLMI